MESLKEKMKSITLIGLIVMAIILSQYVLLGNLSSRTVASGDLTFESNHVEDYISPQSYLISFGGLSYTKVYDSDLQSDIWQGIRPYILSALMDKPTIEKIDQATYAKAFSSKSVLLRMSSGISVSDYVSVLSENNWQEPSALVGIIPYEFLVCSEDPNSLYIYDKKNQNYYELTSSQVSFDVGPIVTKINQTNYIEYRKISTRFSLENTVTEAENQLNYELIPSQYDAVIPSIRVSREVMPDSDRFDEEIKPFINAVFGSRMDFIKRLKDINGSTILMYGYGEKALTVTKTGQVTYTQKIDTTQITESSFSSGLKIAAGAIEVFGQLPSKVTLASYEEEDGPLNVQKYRFSYKLDHYNVDADSGGIEVTIKGNQLSMIKKNVAFYNAETSAGIKELYSIDNCITSNFFQVSLYYLQDNDIYDASLNSIQYYYPIRSAIETVDMSYDLNEDIMTPIWRVVISGRTYYFNAYNGEIIKTYR